MNSNKRFWHPRTCVTKLIIAAAIVLPGFVAHPAAAQEETTYTYDALGRLVVTAVTGGPSNATQSTLSYDPVGNRSALNVSRTSTAPNPPLPQDAANRRFAVVVIGGTYYVIPYNN